MYLVKARKRKFEKITESDFHEFFNRQDVISRGFYPQILRNWRSVFPSDQLLVCFYEELVENPRYLLERIFKFLGVDAVVSWDDFPYETWINKSQRHQMPRALRTHYLKVYEPHILELSNEFADKPLRWLQSAQSMPAILQSGSQS